MYEKDGEKYFVVDGHVHYWEASPGEPQQVRQGFIDCFYGYHTALSPEEYSGRGEVRRSTRKRT